MRYRASREIVWVVVVFRCGGVSVARVAVGVFGVRGRRVVFVVWSAVMGRVRWVRPVWCVLIVSMGMRVWVVVVRVVVVCLRIIGGV